MEPPAGGQPKGLELIIAELENEEYTRAAQTAKELLDALADPATPRKPYVRPLARYFKLFAEGYRFWQISYRYSPVRSTFQLAAYCLGDELRREYEDTPPRRVQLLADALRELTEVVCQYTWCENAFINNDPFQLLARARSAQAPGEKGLKLLVDEDWCEEDPALDGVRSWLVLYLKTNLCLHRGLEACAETYLGLLASPPASAASSRRSLLRAREFLVELEELSAELASELTAHCRHLARHFERIHGAAGRPTRLKLEAGRLVLAISAGMDSSRALEIVKEPEHFRAELEARFREVGIELENPRPDELHDIFQTSFGHDMIRSYTVDFAERVKVRLFAGEAAAPDGRGGFQVAAYSGKLYDFACSINLSALGVCTLTFTLPVEPEEDAEPNSGGAYPISVEEVRSLQSLICPHAGQAGISYAWTPDHLPSHLLGGIDLVELIETVKEVDGRPVPCAEELSQAFQSCHDTLIGTVEAFVERDPGRASHVSASGSALPESSAEEVAEKVSELLKCIRRGAARESQTYQRLEHSCLTFHYLEEIARHHLDLVKGALAGVPEKPGEGLAQGDLAESAWWVAPDSNWYTYVVARTLREENLDGRLLRRNADFPELASHPDLRGFIIEQREARASFDDWRFMDTKIAAESNLALVRSHHTDGFFASEYQAFLYFPDDPQFLIDQYEATVNLMIRVNTALKYHDWVAGSVAERVRGRLRGQASEVPDTADKGSLEGDLLLLRRSKAEASRIRNMIARAGVSRYKDHGDLMKQIVQRMKLDMMGQVLDQQMDDLDQLILGIHEKLEKEKEKEQARKEGKFARVSALISVLLAALAAQNLIAMIVELSPVTRWLTSFCVDQEEEVVNLCVDDAQNLTVMALVFIVLVLFGAWLVRSIKHLEEDRQTTSLPGPGKRPAGR